MARITLRQSYVRVGKLALIKSGRYRHAKQMKRVKKQERFLKVRLERLIRDIERKQDQVVDEKVSEELMILLNKARHIANQKRGDTDYCYAWYCPDVECIGKGKAHKPYEFGVKVSIADLLYSPTQTILSISHIHKLICLKLNKFRSKLLSNAWIYCRCT